MPRWERWPRRVRRSLDGLQLALERGDPHFEGAHAGETAQELVQKSHAEPTLERTPPPAMAISATDQHRLRGKPIVAPWFMIAPVRSSFFHCA